MITEIGNRGEGTARKCHIEAWFIYYGDICRGIMGSERKLGLGYLFEVLPPKIQYQLQFVAENKSIILIQKKEDS